MEAPAATAPRSSLGEVARLFLRLGVLGFGGPAAHIAMMRDEVVRRRAWMDDGEFMDLVGATNLIPGPNSTELAIHLGHRRAGGRGLVVAGVAFIAPAVVIVGVLAWLYRSHGTDPAIADLRYGILPVIIAIVAHALVGLGRATFRTPARIVVALGAFAGFVLGVHELAILLASGVAMAAWSRRRHPARRVTSFALLPLAAAYRPARVSLGRLFLVFLEVGSVLYGSGYVLLAFLQRHLVDRLGWLSERQLLDAVAVGQLTPGPVFTTATFVGWQVAGPAGAAVATVGIFGPSFAFVAVLGRIVPWMQRRPAARAFLDGLNAASLGLMAGVLVVLTRTALTDAVTVALAVAALGLLLRTRWNSGWLVGLGALVGIAHALAT